MTALSPGANNFTTTGAQTVTTPSAGTIDVEVWAAGGGSSGTHSAGGGGYSKVASLSVTSGQNVFLNVGAGGVAAANGGDSWVNINSNAAPAVTTDGSMAKGGTFGSSGQTGAGGLAANGVGTTKFSGGNGL